MKLNKKVLKNGLTVLHEQRDVPVTTVMLGVKYGSAYEDEKEKGIAHFIEHLCFKGTEKRTAKEIAYELEKVGGILNAFTSEELTAYHVKLPSNHLDIAMEVIFDIFFNPIFPEADVKKEANVICEEIKMYNDEPRAHSIEKIKENLYEKPFGMFIAGTEKNIRSMNRKQLLDNHRKIYVPENSVLAVVGNNNFDEVVKFTEKFCIERRGEKQEIPKIEFQNLKEEEKRKNLQQANVVLGFHFPTSSEKEKYAAEVFSTILGFGMSSKLFTEVREKRGLVYAVKTDLDLGDSYGYMLIYAGTEKSKVDEVIDICLKEFHEMKKLTKKELEEGKEQIIGNYNVSLEGSNETALNLILEEVSDKAENFYKYAENVNKVSLADIKKLAEKIEYSSFVLSP
tara:strand:+ start:2076 stop:3266 length:1191 start_codon:yes stop_codon:yes gene_type:complete